MDHPASQFYDAIVDSAYTGPEGELHLAGVDRPWRMYRSLQAAIDATSEGRIGVRRGVYIEQVDVSRETEE